MIDKTRVVTYSDAEGDKTITISRSTGYIALKRSTLIGEAIEANRNELDMNRVFARRFMYPGAIAATVSCTGFAHWPPTFDEFLDLPERLFSDWLEAVNQLNPHWSDELDRILSEAEQAEQEKKILNSPGG